MDTEGRRKLPRSGYPRRRAVTACSTCRERKKKCDNARPACSFCQQVGAQCEYSSRDASSYDAASLTILDHLSLIETLVRRIPVDSSPEAPSVRSRQSHTTLSPMPVSLDRPSGCLPSTANAIPRSLDLDSNYRVGTDEILQWPIFEQALSSLRRYPYIHFCSTNAYTYLNDAFNTSEPSNAQFMPQSASESTVALNISTERSDIEHLVSRFFKNVHVKNPILDRQAVLKYCREYYEHGALFNLETGLVLIICALGAVAADFDPSSNWYQDSSIRSANHESLRLGKCYFAAAEKRLGLAMAQPSTLAVQCLCLSGIYQMYTINPIAALRLFHAAGSSLQLLVATKYALVPASQTIYRFNADSPNSTDPSEGTVQLSSSLCWTCFKSEREILAEIPLAAPALSELGISEQYPGPPQTVFVSSGDGEWADTEEDSWYFFLSEIALRRLTDKVAEVVVNHIDCSFASSQQAAMEELVPIVIELERQAHTWRENLPLQVQFPDVPHAADTEWRHYSRSRYYRVLELMFRPFVFMAIHVPECSPTVRALASKGLSSALNYLLHCNLTHRHQGLWLTLRNQLKETCLLLASAIAGLEMPQDWYTGIQRTIQSLECWRQEFPYCQSYLNVIHTLIGHFESREGGALTSFSHRQGKNREVS